MRMRARQLTREYNQTKEDELTRRTLLLKDLFGKAGEGTYIEPPFYCDYGSNIYTDDNLYMNFGCTILDCATVHFGESVLCGPHVQIYTVNHPLDATARSAGAEYAKPIKIGSRVWLGGGAMQDYS